MPETFHIPAAMLRWKSLVPETGPGQAAFLRQMRRGQTSLFERAWKALGSLSVILVLVGAITTVPTPGFADEGKTGAVSQEVPSNGQYLRTRVVHSLEATFVRATDSQLGPALAQVVKRIIVWWMNPRRDLRAGDVIEVVYEERPNAEPVVFAIWMRSQKYKKRWSAVRYRAKKSPFYRYYSPNGYEVERRLRRSPVRSYEQITSLLNDGRGHRGIDFKAPIGTPIYAPFSGVVRRRNWSTRRNGRCLELYDPKTGRKALFLHLNYIYRRIRPGVRVRVGQKIATLGNTGRSSAPHLHYQLERSNGRLLNPLRVHRTWRARLAPDETKKARRVLERLALMRTGST